MKPIKFEDANVTFAQGQRDYIPLPALALETPEKHVITCWKLSWKERIIVMFTGRLWMSQLTFGNRLQPILPVTDRRELYVKN